MDKKGKIKSVKNNDAILIGITKIFLFPLYVIGVVLRNYDELKMILLDFFKYKILRRKKEDILEEWWIS